jgi:hypothetical protein
MQNLQKVFIKIQIINPSSNKNLILIKYLVKKNEFKEIKLF